MSTMMTIEDLEKLAAGFSKAEAKASPWDRLVKSEHGGVQEGRTDGWQRRIRRIPLAVVFDDDTGFVLLRQAFEEAYELRGVLGNDEKSKRPVMSDIIPRYPVKSMVEAEEILMRLGWTM